MRILFLLICISSVIYSQTDSLPVKEHTVNQEIIVTSPREGANLEGYFLNQQEINNIPNLYSDALRSIHLIAGVTSNNELSSSYNVHGGSFNENLIYLNGFEIYRPFLLRLGVEENQSIINPDMTEKIKFYGNGFAASYGDKMSSALLINYKNEFENTLRGNVKADITRFSIMFCKKSGDFNVSFSSRYANPSLFLKILKTKGKYFPSYLDQQAVINYKITGRSSLEALILNSQNDFSISPSEYKRNMVRSIALIGEKDKKIINGIKVEFNGSRNFEYFTRAGGLRYRNSFDSGIKISAEAFLYHTHETEYSDLQSNFFVTDNPFSYLSTDYEYVKSDNQKINNTFELSAFQTKLALNASIGAHSIETGLVYKRINIINSLYEFYFSRSSGYTLEAPSLKAIQTRPQFYSSEAYIQDDFMASNILKINAGVRFFRYEYSNENLLSPRFAMYYLPSKHHTFSAAFGYYYQPPFYYEIKNAPDLSENILKSQLSVNYSIGWDYLFKDKVKFQLQCYYKDLSDIIPCYADQLNLEFGPSNSHEGYAYGADFLFYGEITRDLNSWISYSYLNSREREAGKGNNYERRFLDQNHTFLIFLQDKMPRHPNIQAHLRFVFGSGLLFPVRKAAEETGQYRKITDLNDREEYPFYMRADMGLTYSTTILENTALRLILEVMNVFDNQNVSGYIWINTIRELKQPFPVQQLYSERFFNLGIDINF